MKTDTIRLPRLRLLARRLSVPFYSAVGLFELLLNVAIDQAPDGGIGRRLSDEEIELAVEWDGEPGALILALTQLGFIEQNEDARLIIREWAVMAPDFVHRKLKRKGLKFVDGTQPKSDRGSGQKAKEEELGDQWATNGRPMVAVGRGEGEGVGIGMGNRDGDGDGVGEAGPVLSHPTAATKQLGQSGLIPDTTPEGLADELAQLIEATSPPTSLCKGKGKPERRAAIAQSLKDIDGAEAIIRRLCRDWRLDKGLEDILCALRLYPDGTLPKEDGASRLGHAAGIFRRMDAPKKESKSQRNLRESAEWGGLPDDKLPF